MVLKPSPPVKVCMLIPSYHPLVGGAEIQLGGLLKMFDRKRFAPFVLTRQIAGTGTAGMDGQTPVIRRSAPIRPGMFVLSALRYLLKRHKEYDVVHVHSFDSPAIAGAIVKHFFPHKKYIQRIPRFGDGSSFDRLRKSAVGRARLRFALSKADAVIPLCPDASQALEDMGLEHHKIAPIPNGVDTGAFAPPAAGEKTDFRRSMGIPATAFTGILAARLIPRKNVHTALEAWKRVVDAYPDATLIVAGDGPDGPRLAGFADNNFSGRSVIFTGKTSREKIAQLYRTADVYLSYSASEGMSNAMLEGMSSGLPVVAARGPGIDQMVSHAQTGFLFDADRPMDGADYLTRLAEDRGLLVTMSEAVRHEVEARYSFEKIARDIECLYTGEASNDSSGARVALGEIPRHSDGSKSPTSPGTP